MEIKKIAVFMYALSFLGYACSGHGINILGNLKDVLSAQHIFGNLFEKSVRTLAGKFLDTLENTVEEECIYTCKDGSKPIKNKYYTATSNGCGIPGLSLSKDQLGSLKEMTECCDEHDICYGTCNEDKEKCDHNFKKCLYKVCSAMEDTVSHLIVTRCKSTAKMLFTASLTLGCQFYKVAQEEACYCAPHKKRNEF